MHHSRRKSGHGSMTDVRKAASASDVKHKSGKQSGNNSRRTNNSSSQPTSKSGKSGSLSRDTDMAPDDDYAYDDERENADTMIKNMAPA
ncbi:hypothetical protein SEPCBS119000_005168 [Sporothrix epigloea]|uniref:Uncharacterized protein n=1 Tax=Sporothrix epigloea TaxID=1892477 RepID=A0ABP0DZW7_9PEZI